MSHIVKRDEETGKYVAESTETPGLKATANSLYDAVEELQKIESELASVG